ncbi:hypothetical protein GMA19_04745 [Paenibacillus polymyxa E681]|nr:hypothetical protein GE561_04756 [Paenibacillus polymyxa E681]QNV64354.1 hypothetical protein GMA19_04745 [Paenibacillus polymyxa E681]
MNVEPFRCSSDSIISSTTYIQGEFQWLEVQVLTHL